jgi:hypothetical protein
MSWAQGSNSALPAFSVKQEGAVRLLKFHIDSSMHPKPHFELPPVTVEGDVGYFFVTTGYSWLCEMPADGLFGAQPISLSIKTCKLFSRPNWLDLSTGAGLPLAQMRVGGPWSRNYDGVMLAFLSENSVSSRQLVAIAHGENKNERVGNRLYNGTVNVGVDASRCYSGNHNGVYQDCWPSYNGFTNEIEASLSTPFQLSAIKDLGPVLWPSAGYVEPLSQIKMSAGTRHFSGIIANKYLYVFYVDTSHSDHLGRSGGLYLARARIDEGGSILKFRPYFQGNFPSESSLPSGFESARTGDFFSAEGARGSELWPLSHRSLSFHVAHVTGTPFFVGVEEYLFKNTWKLQMRISRDLKNWSPPVGVPGQATLEGWKHAQLHYATLINQNGLYEDRIDPGIFYIIGTNDHGEVFGAPFDLTGLVGVR